MNKLQEAIVGITWALVHHYGTELSESPDSRETVQLIIGFAESFEEAYAGRNWDDNYITYRELIDFWARDSYKHYQKIDSAPVEWTVQGVQLVGRYDHKLYAEHLWAPSACIAMQRARECIPNFRITAVLRGHLPLARED